MLTIHLKYSLGLKNTNNIFSCFFMFFSKSGVWLMLTNYCICSSKLNCHSTSFMCSRHREVGKRRELLKMSIWWCSFTFSFVFVNLQQQQQLSIADNDIQGWSFVCLRCLSKSAHYRQQQIYAECHPALKCVPGFDVFIMTPGPPANRLAPGLGVVITQL